MNIHILDRKTDEIKDFLTNRQNNKVVLDDKHIRNIESNTETYDFTVDYVAAQNIQVRDRVLIPDEDKGHFREFVVDDTETDTYNGETEVKTVASYLEDLEKAKPFEPQTIQQYTAPQAVEFALQHTKWEIGTVEFGGIRTISWTSYNNPFEVLKIIANRFELQLDFTIEIGSNKIERRLVHLRERTALFNGKEVKRGKDLQNLTVQRSATDVVTALLAVAPEPQEEDAERVTVIVTDAEAQAQLGKEKDYIWGLYEPQSDDGGMTEARLRTLATTELNKRKQPKIDYSIEAVDLEEFLAHEQVRIGDKIRIKDDLQEPMFYADATVKGVVRSIFNPLDKTYTLGEITEYTKEDITKIFEQFRALLAKRMAETQSNLDNIVTIIDTAVERRIFKQPNPPENPINGQLWLDTSNSDKPVLMEYFNGQWIVRIAAVTEADDIGAITRSQAMYEAILTALESFEVLHIQILTEANQIKLNKYLNQSNKDNLDNRILTVVDTHNDLKAEIAKHEDTKAITLDDANDIQLLMSAYTDSIKNLKEAITIATNYAMEHLAILQSQYSEEKYTEALEEVAGKFGMTVEDGKLIGDTVLLEDLNNTKTELQNQLDAAKETLELLESSNTSNETSISTLTQEITNLEGLIASKVSQSDYDLLDKTVTDMSTEVSQTAEAVSTKAEKSYVDTIKGTVENHSLSITEHAEGIDTLITKTNTHDGQITDVTNTATETAEGLEQTITKVTKAEGAITQAQADIVTNTEEIGTKLATATYTVDKEGIVGRLDTADSERTQLSNEIKDRVTLTDYESDKEAQAGRLSTLETSIEQNGQAITLKASQEDLDSIESTLSTKQAQLEVKATGIESSVEGLNDDLAQTKTSINQSIEGITQEVAANKKGITDANSKIEQTAEEINLEVGKKVGTASEIISRINQTSEKITIDANKINISGQSINIGDNPAITGLNTSVGTAQSTANTAKSQADAARVGANIASSINNAPSSVSINADRINLTAGSSIRLAINKAEKAGTDAQSEIDNLDVGSENLLPDSGWHKEPAGTYLIPNNWRRAVGGIVWSARQSSNWLLARVNYEADGTNGATTASYYGLRSPQILESLIAGQEYTFTFKTRHNSGGNMNYRYTYIINDNNSNQVIRPVFIRNADNGGQLWSVTFTANYSDTGHILIGHSIPSGSSNAFFLKEPMLYKGNAISSWADSIQNKTDKDKIVSAINLDDSGVQISGSKINLVGDVDILNGNTRIKNLNLNNATVTGGTGKNTISINNNEIISHGLFTRTWAGETDTAELNLGIRQGRIMVSNENTGYNLYFTEKGLSTTMAGATAGYSAGTLEFHSQRFNQTSRGVTLHSTFGTVALISDESTIVTRSKFTNNIESEEYSVYIRPYMNSRAGTNDFRFWVKDNSSSYYTDGVLSFGNLDSDTFGSGLRFSKSSNENTVYVTNSNGDIGTGHISVLDAEIRGHIRTAGRINFQQWNDRSAYNQIGVGAVNTYNSIMMASHSGSNAYLGVGTSELRVTDNNGYNGGNTTYRNVRLNSLEMYGSISNHSGGNVYFGVANSELRVTNNNLYNGGNTTYRDIRINQLHTTGGFQHHSSAGYVYFGVGGSTGMRITNNNLYNGGNIGWRDIEFRNWKANSHEKYKKDIEEWNTNVLDIFKNELQLYQYKFKDNLENNMIHRSIVLREDSTDDQFPAEWRQDDGYNGNEVMWWNTKAIQELAYENDELKTKNQELEERLEKLEQILLK
ncbi:MAG TPA: hypothetical protein DEB42_00590 [Jeotgalicoccus sp.]|nr:hypothetical protein [Jeotgalicoccus sp.]